MKRDREPYVFRRHALDCPYSGPGGRETRADKCRCPFHADGIYGTQRIRRTLRTRSRQIADRRLTEILRKLDCALEQSRTTGGDEPMTLAQSVDRFLRSRGELTSDGEFHSHVVTYSTWRKYRTKLNLLLHFAKSQRVTSLDDVTVDFLEDFARSRSIATVTWKVELQAFRTFFGFCVSRKWITANPARDVQSPRNLKPNDVEPYTHEEDALILAACDQIGGGKYHRSGARYEQIRARGMLLLLQCTALRISDVALMRRDAISWDPQKSTWRVYLRTLKTGDSIFLPIPLIVKQALDAIPIPRGAAQNCPYYFWNGESKQRAAVGIAERSLAQVFKKSGVKKAHAHRFRHTLATRLLGRGVSFERVADILGNSPAVVRKHYGKWSKEHQDGIDQAMMDYQASIAATSPVTDQSHENLEPVN